MSDVQDQSPVADAAPVPFDDAPARLRFRDDAPDDGPLVSLADLLLDSNAAAVRLDPADDARKLLPHLGRLRLIEVTFPKYRDGRGYSTARIVREAGFTGELRAAGDVLLDQIVFMRRVGFDSFAPVKPLDPAQVETALKRFPFVYQKAADDQQPVWALRG
ncbi:DUF934 domain-containing protein [Glacieibacterium frigidum]|uniref:DUF934 domain-containing protein n=1 Tax=Glacieibacterium frigidum TaxID=2593303 RepID=A0A552U7V4_9SPHN|nr:DUF934 domain-containing protein [Glacieibacterium frigidum]TRW14298.1 DUF934 domain-containing protein [Glacieibacterium frigidum]